MARGLGATFRFGGVRKIDADHRCDSARRYRDSRRPIPVRISHAAWAALRTILLTLLVLAPTSAWAESAGCTAINALGGTFTVDGAGNGTDKFTDPGSQPLANGETVTYSWSGNTKGAYLYIVWTQGGGSAYAASSVEDATATTGSGSFTFSGTSAGDYFQVGLANTDYFTTNTPKPSANNSSVTINLSCSAGAILGVSMTHSGNAAQGGSLAYTITPSASGSATTTALLTANFTLPSGMTYTSASGTGWTCSGSGQTGTCTRTGSFGPGAGPTITLNTAFAANASSPLLPSVALSGGGGTNAPSAADSTIVLQRPTVTSISPTAGPLAGGTTVVITGTNFTGATGVAFGASPATGFTINSATQITATAPAGTGTIDVQVTTAGGASAFSAADQYTYVAAPTAANLSNVPVAFNTATPIDLSGSITGSHTSIAVVTAPAHGSTSIADDVVTYTPSAAYAGPESFTYTATGAGGTSAPATVTLTVAQGSQTIIFAALPDASLSASPLTLSATASSGLTVSFSSTTPSVCTVSGTTLTMLQPGACSIDANQAGNSSYTAAPTVSRSFTVTPAALVVTAGAASGATVGASYSQGNPASGGTAPYAYSLASGSLPAGTTLDSSTGTVSGTPTTAGAFSYAIGASDSQGTPATATGATVSGTIAKGDQTIGFTSTAPSAATAGGASYTISATATSHLTVTFSLDGASTGCALAGSTVTFTGAGTCRIDADQSGDSNWNAAPQVQQSFTVNAASAIGASIAFSPASLAAGSSGTLTISFTNSNATVSPAFDTLLTADTSVLSRIAGAPGGTCAGFGASVPSTATVQFSNIAVPAGGCTITIGFAGSSAGTAAGFTLSGFTPSGYPTTPGATSNAVAVVPSVTAVSPNAGPAGQVVTITGAGFSATPANNTVHFGSAVGTVTAASATSLTVTTPATGSGAVTVSVTVNGQTSTGGTTYSFIDKPIAADKPGIGIAYDSTGTPIDLSGSISGGPHTSIAIGTAPSHGTTSIAGDVVTYTPATGYFGSDSFTYTAAGPGGTSNVATVSLTIATPAAPVAADKPGVGVSYNSPGTPIDLAGSITGVHTSIAIGSAPAHGTTSVAGDVVTYTPSAGYYGADSFTYTATGPGGTSAPATVGIVVGSPAAPSVANINGVAVPYGSSGTAIDTSAAISGVHGSIAVASGPAHGTTSVAGDVITYTPATGYYGADSFTYTATGPGGTSAPATISLTVATPAAPTVAARSDVSVPFGSNGTAIDLAASISGVHTSIAVATAPAHGTTSVAGDVVTYTPAAGYFGTDSFTYTATGPGGTSAPAAVTLTVATPAAPVAGNRAGVSVAYDSPGTAIDLSTAITGVHTSIAVVTAPSHGTTSVAGDVVTYTPAPGYFGADTFTYTATGPGGTSAPGTVSLTVAAPAAPTVANRSGVSVAFNSSGTAIDLSGSITGVHTSIAVTAPAHGALSVSGDTVTYVPATGYFGADSFTYTATGPGGTSASATVSLTVAVPPAPSVTNKTGVAVPYGSTGTAIDLSGSISGVHTAIAVATAPAHGSVTISGDVATYTPAAGYFGADSFTFTATGPGGTSPAATVSLTIATPPAPTVTGKSGVAVPYDSPGTGIDLAGSVTGLHTSLAIGAAPAHGSVTISGDVATYIPTAGYFGADSFTFTATGPGGTSPAATVSLTVATPPAPVAQSGSGTVAASAQGQNSVDIDLASLVTGDYTSIELAGQPAHGAVTLHGASGGGATIATYTPAAGFAGTDSFSFVAVGPGGRSAPAAVTIKVIGAVPTAIAKVASATDNQTVSIDLTEGATEGPFTGAAIVSISPAADATATVVESGGTSGHGYRLDVTPAAHFSGTIVVIYTLSNQFGASAPATVTIAVTARPDPSLDPSVRALSDAQAESTRLFAQAQSNNFLQRAEQLHNGGGSARPHMGISLGLMDMNSASGPDYSAAGRREMQDVSDRARGVPGPGMAGAGSKRSPGPVKSAMSDDGGDRPIGSVAIWSGGQIEIGTRDQTTDRDKISLTTGGLSAGADIKLSEAASVGLGGGIGFDDSKIGGQAASVHGDSQVLAAYGSVTPITGMFVDVVTGYGNLDFKTRRAIGSALALGSRGGTMWFGAASTGVDRTDGGVRWSLYGRGEWLDGTLGAYAEHGAGLMDLRFDQRDVNSLTGVLGGRFELNEPLEIGSFRPRVRLEWSHEFQDSSIQMLDYADITGDAFYGIRTEGWNRDQYEVAFGGGLYTLSRWVVDLEIGMRTSSGERDGRLTLKLSKDF